MDKGIFCWSEVELSWRCSDISLLEPIGFVGAVDASDENKMTNIKFSFLVEQRILNIFLDDEGSEFPVWISLSSFQS